MVLHGSTMHTRQFSYRAHRHADYKRSIVQLRDVVLQVLDKRRIEGVLPEDRDLLSFMLRAAEHDTMLTDDDIVFELQGAC